MVPFQKIFCYRNLHKRLQPQYRDSNTKFANLDSICFYRERSERLVPILETSYDFIWLTGVCLAATKQKGIFLQTKKIIKEVFWTVGKPLYWFKLISQKRFKYRYNLGYYNKCIFLAYILSARKILIRFDLPIIKKKTFIIVFLNFLHVLLCSFTNVAVESVISISACKLRPMWKNNHFNLIWFVLCRLHQPQCFRFYYGNKQ